jgi:hypothetical protein
MFKGRNGWRLLFVAFAGALLIEVVQILSEGAENTFSVERIPHHLAALAVGALLGWMFELLRELSGTTITSLEDIRGLTSKITYQDEALEMVMGSKLHKDLLTDLVEKSMHQNFRNVPYVNEAEYLTFLTRAVEHSNRFQGIQRRALSWFQENSAKRYSCTLRDRRMQGKTRLFVLDDSEAAQMRRDVEDAGVLSAYWEMSGDIESYWLTFDEYKRNFPNVRVPDDFALFDDTLLIAYDPDHQVLTFDLLNDTAHERLIFERLAGLSEQGVPALHKIPRNAVPEHALAT